VLRADVEFVVVVLEVGGWRKKKSEVSGRLDIWWISLAGHMVPTSDWLAGIQAADGRWQARVTWGPERGESRS
jgi:hypothetical protein